MKPICKAPIPLISDEMARTGTLFACEQAEVPVCRFFKLLRAETFF